MQQDSTHKHTRDSWRETETDRQTYIHTYTQRHAKKDTDRQAETDRLVYN